jgi:Otopetrin
MVLTPICRLILTIFQMQFIFLNTVELDMGRHKVIARFGLMHMVATNLCEWLYVLVEETKHEIFHLTHHDDDHHGGHHGGAAKKLKSLLAETVNTTMATIVGPHTNETDLDMHNITKRSSTNADYLICQRTNIMGNLVQNASPFLFPCTIEWSLICAVILFEMWKQVRSLPEIERTRRNSVKPPHPSQMKKAHHFSVDCSRAHRGMFAGILVIVLTIISLIMYFVLHNEKEYKVLAMLEVTICEIILYTITSGAVIWAFYQMRDMKYQRKSNGKKDYSIIVAEVQQYS